MNFIPQRRNLGRLNSLVTLSQNEASRMLDVLLCSVSEYWPYCTLPASLALFPPSDVPGHSIGYPVATFITRSPLSNFGGFNIGGLNASGQVGGHLRAAFSSALFTHGSHFSAYRFLRYPETGDSSISTLQKRSIQNLAGRTPRRQCNWSFLTRLTLMAEHSTQETTLIGKLSIYIIG